MFIILIYIILKINRKLSKQLINQSLVKNWILFDKLGRTSSLENNLIASLNGCINLIILSLLGPLWI